MVTLPQGLSSALQTSIYEPALKDLGSGRGRAAGAVEGWASLGGHQFPHPQHTLLRLHLPFHAVVVRVILSVLRLRGTDQFPEIPGKEGKSEQGAQARSRASSGGESPRHKGELGQGPPLLSDSLANEGSSEQILHGANPPALVRRPVELELSPEKGGS